MSSILPEKYPVEQSWLTQLKESFSDPETILRYLELNLDNFQEDIKARRLFPVRVSKAFLDKMAKGNAEDPLFKQVFCSRKEFVQTQGFDQDPLCENEDKEQGFLHKYKNRVLIMLKASCATNCRYCFRRHFGHESYKGNKAQWQQAIDYIAQHPEVNEVLLSGGDPLMAKDHELDWLFQQLQAIPHLTRLRIHTRLPVMIPERITDELCDLFIRNRLQIIFVTHINHANEIDEHLASAIQKLKVAGVTLLNQGVLLKGVNDDPHTLAQLMNRLFDIGILPYYLHVLDHVQGAAHFLVSDSEAKAIMRTLMTLISGYLVPRLTREEPDKPSKTVLGIF